MAIIDDKLELMDATSIAGANTATTGSDVLDLGVAYDGWGQSKTPDIGEGGDMWLNVRVATTLTGGTSTPYVTCRLYTHTNYSNVDAGTLLLTQVIGTAAAAGTDVLRAKIPAGTVSRYLQLVNTVGASTISTGALDAWISLDTESVCPTT